MKTTLDIHILLSIIVTGRSEKRKREVSCHDYLTLFPNIQKDQNEKNNGSGFWTFFNGFYLDRMLCLKRWSFMSSDRDNI